MVKIIVLHREEGVEHRNRKSCETQRLEVIDLLHQPWKHTREQHVTRLPRDEEEEEEEECVLPLDRKSLPTQTSGATTVTLSTAMALRKTRHTRHTHACATHHRSPDRGGSPGVHVSDLLIEVSAADDL